MDMWSPGPGYSAPRWHDSQGHLETGVGPKRTWDIYLAYYLADFTPEAQQTLLREGLMPSHGIQVHISEILRSVPTAGQWFCCSRVDPTLPIFSVTATLMDQTQFQRYCLERERMLRGGNR